MCIIVYKPTGIESPSWATLHQCFDYNSDGAGFMYAENGKVYIQKGYMTWNSFKWNRKRIMSSFPTYK